MVVVRGETNKTQAHPSFVRPPTSTRRKKRGEKAIRSTRSEIFVFFWKKKKTKKTSETIIKKNEVCGKSGERSPESGGEEKNGSAVDPGAVSDTLN